MSLGLALKTKSLSLHSNSSFLLSLKEDRGREQLQGQAGGGRHQQTHLLWPSLPAFPFPQCKNPALHIYLSIHVLMP